MKKLLIFIVLLAAIGGYFVISKPDTDDGAATPTPVSQMTETPQATSTPTPVVSAAAAPKSATFTMAQVAQHKTEADCYTAISGAVYDLTAFVTKHPGGDRAIFKICGIDGTSAFQNQHGGQQKQMELLATFKIGVVVK